MIVQLRDGPLVIGFGRTIDEAVRIAVDINKRVGDEPTCPHELRRMIDCGSIKVREIRERGD
jgi:hypothetical protein